MFGLDLGVLFIVMDAAVCFVGVFGFGTLFDGVLCGVCIVEVV